MKGFSTGDDMTWALTLLMRLTATLFRLMGERGRDARGRPRHGHSALKTFVATAFSDFWTAGHFLIEASPVRFVHEHAILGGEGP